MEWNLNLKKEQLEIGVTNVGQDLLVCVSGGEKPHIGTAVLALPRPSLSGSGEISATSSVLNLTGHKDELLCRDLAEQLCRAANCTVICTGGFHTDHMTPQQLIEVTNAMKDLTAEIIKTFVTPDEA